VVCSDSVSWAGSNKRVSGMSGWDLNTFKEKKLGEENRDR
jgi:hypothetical protein